MQVDIISANLDNYLYINHTIFNNTSWLSYIKCVYYVYVYGKFNVLMFWPVMEYTRKLVLIIASNNKPARNSQ